MKKIHIIPYICLFIAISTLFGCVDQSEKVQSLEDANEKLVLKNVTLEAALKTKEKNIEELQLTNKFLESKISKLQETDQNYFIAAVDLYKKADTLTQLGNTKKSFNDLIIKFPNSQLVDDSKKYINELDLKIGILESQNKFIKDFQDCISSKNWNQALSLLEDNRNILKESEYLDLS